MHLVLFSTSLHVSVSFYCFFISCVKQLQSSQSHLQKWPPRCELLSARVLWRTFNRKFQRVTDVWNFSLQLTTAFQDHQTLKRICWIPTNICPARPFHLLQCELLVRTALTKHYGHVLSCFSLSERLMKGNVSKNTVWMRSCD